MLKKYTQEQKWSVYEKLPEDLKEMLFSTHTSDEIGNISKSNDVSGSKLAELVGYVLMGFLPPEELKEALKTELEISPELAKRLCLEIERFILHPVKNSLNEIYNPEYISKKTSTPPSLKPRAPSSYSGRIEKDEQEKKELSEESNTLYEKKPSEITAEPIKRKGEKDTYRESIDE